MRTLPLSILLLFMCCGTSSGVIAQNTIVAHLQFRDVKEKPIASRQFIIYKADHTPLLKGITDASGNYNATLTRGATVTIEFSESGEDWSFEMEVPSDAAMNAFTSVCKISLEAGIAARPAAAGSAEALATIILQNKEKKVLAGHDFSVYNEAGNFVLGAQTDASGKATLKLKKNATFKLTTTAYGMDYDATFKVPDADKFTFQFTMGYTQQMITEYEQRMNGNASGKTHLIFKVTDENNVSEQEAVISLAQNGNEIYNCTTGLDGTCTTDIDQYQDYDLTISKFGRTFKKKVSLPRDERLSEYVYNITIQVVKQYKRTYTLDNVYFDYDRSDLRADSYPALNTLYKAMSENPAMTVEIAGHTDNKGPDDYNMQLSQRRANSVRDYLVKKGIASNRILPKGYGENEPIATNDTEEGRQKNRRTEVRVISE